MFWTKILFISLIPLTSGEGAVCVEDGDDGSSYRGDVAVTESGVVCQRWDSQLPNDHGKTPEGYPNEGLNENYCRNPDGGSGPWCYNAEGTSPKWEYCDVPKCVRAVCVKDGDDGSSYRGDVAVTKSGVVCQRWDSQLPNDHGKTPEGYPNEGLNENYCRNPDGGSGPWCYNAEGTSPKWEYCDVPKCVGNLVTESTAAPATVPINVLCGEDEHTCADDGKCWALSFVCDGENQCGDGSDEADCEETCDPEEAEVVIPGGTFVSEREEGMNYKDGDTVNYVCNENFAMEGNPFVVCSGRKFNSEPPKCTAVNTNCDEFTVENGKLGINHPYLTNDEVQVTCKTDYIPDGTNPRKCVENGWEEDAPVCVTDDGTQCVPLSPPKNGDFTCSGLDEGKAVAGSKCSVFCEESFLAVEDAVEETTCEDDSFT